MNGANRNEESGLTKQMISAEAYLELERYTPGPPEVFNGYNRIRQLRAPVLIADACMASAFKIVNFILIFTIS